MESHAYAHTNTHSRTRTHTHAWTHTIDRSGSGKCSLCPPQLCSSYGAIRKVRMVLDNKTKKPRGYAFIEFERERDTRNAYKQASHRIA